VRRERQASRRFSQARAAWTLFLAVVAAGLGWLLYQWITWPDVGVLANENPTSTAFIEAYNESVAGAGGTAEVDWRWVPYDEISPLLKRGVLVAEDIEFFTHNGFSTTEIRAAIEDAVERGEALRGASTITQQLAKNLWLTPSRNPIRKLTEAILTWQLEKHLEKHRILDIYLNVAEFGTGIYGAEAASRYYFNKPASQLTRHEAALLAASLPRPTSWNPHNQVNRYMARVDRIEIQIIQARFLRRYVG
jgi:monofunctional biosynthetic peptidoglycan transglycosylase